MEVEEIEDIAELRILNKKDKTEILGKAKKLKELKKSNRKISEMLGVIRNRINNLLKDNIK